MITRNTYDSKPLNFNYYRPTEGDQESEFHNHREINAKQRQVNSLVADQCFTKDRAFVKFLTWINLQSEDKEAISMARLVAYNIFNQLKNDAHNYDDVLTGIVNGFKVILTNLTKFSKDISKDPELILKACREYSKGIRDIEDVVSFLNEPGCQRSLMVTKEISGRIHEGLMNVQQSLQVNAGHASYSSINDNLNYRVDISHPLIVICENLDTSTIEKSKQIAEETGKRILFISKTFNQNSNPGEADLKILGSTPYLNLSDLSSDCDKIFVELCENLPEIGELAFDEQVHYKTSERIVMNNDSTNFFHSKFETDEFKSHSLHQEIVEVRLRGPDETWIHRFRTDLIDAHKDLKDSLKSGVLPDIATSLSLVNKELKTYYSDNQDIQRGIEIFQRSIDEIVLEMNEMDVHDGSLIEERINASIAEGNFIPSTKVTNVVTDIVTICNYLLQNE